MSPSTTGTGSPACAHRAPRRRARDSVCASASGNWSRPIGAELAHRVEHARQELGDLARPAARQEEHGPAASGRARARRRVSSRPRVPRTRSSSGWPTNSTTQAAAGVERRLEREDDRQPVHAPRDRAYPAAPPGPDLRADVVEHRHAGPLGGAREPQVELGEVDQDAEVGRVLAQLRGRACGRRASSGAQPARRLDDADGRDLAGIDQRLHARLRAAAAPPMPKTSTSGTRARSACSRSAPCRSPDASPATSSTRGGRPPAARGTAARSAAGRRRHACAKACAARTSVSTLSRITCATSSARSPSQPLTGGASRAAHGAQEGVDLVLERVVARAPRASSTPSGRLPVVARLAAADAHLALAVVDREVGVGLEDAELPLPLQRHAARGDVGDAAVGEAQPRVRDVDRRRSAPGRRPPRPRGRRRHHAEDHVEVVDHQVEHHVDVGAALGERRQAMALDEARLRDQAVERADRRD